MKIHQLAIFWRDQQARAFTSFHFTVPAKESARERAHKIVSLFEQFTTLQIYGAVVDDKPLTIDLSSPAPPTGTDRRLEINLYPDAPLAPRYGVVPIGFTIPGPNEAAAALIKNPQQQPAWQGLEKELLPFICLVRGHHVSPDANPIKRIELVAIDEENRPQPGQPPVDDALRVTEQKITGAETQFAQLRRRGEEPTPKDFERLKKYQDHLARLTSLKQLEENFFAHAGARAPQPPIPLIPAGASRALKLEEKMPEVNTANQEEQEITALLPADPEQPEIWTDIPKAHFFDHRYWLSSAAIRKEFALTERSYYRWLDALKRYGLERVLPDRQHPKIKLFYRPDLEQALRAATAAGAFRKPGRPAEPAAQPAKSMAPTARQAPGVPLVAPAAHAAGGRVAPEMAVKFDTILHQQQAILQQLAQLTERLANQPNLAEVMGRAFDLLANFGNFNQLTAQLLARLDKIENRLHTLPASLAHKQTKKKAATKPAPAKVALPINKAKAKAITKPKKKR